MYKSVITWTEDELKTHLEISMLGGSPFYVRDGEIFQPSDCPGERIKTLPAVPNIVYGGRRGIDPYAIGHKYPR